MSGTTRPTVPVAAGFTALLGSLLAALWLGDARWLAVGVAALLAGAAWSATVDKR